MLIELTCIINKKFKWYCECDFEWIIWMHWDECFDLYLRDLKLIINTW